MNRATFIYIVMLAAGVGGLWLIIRLGSGLAAPTDLSGVWGVGGEDPAIPQVLGQTVHVEQSGRFFRLNFEGGLRVDVKLVSENRPKPGTDDGLDLRFRGPDWSLSALGAGSSGPLIFRLDGPQKHVFTVTRLAPVSGVGGDAHAAATAAAAASPATPPAVAATDADADPGSNGP